MVKIMNNELMNETKLFVGKIRKSPEYVDYLNYKSIIDRNQDLSEQVDAFRRKSFEIQAGHRYGYFNAYENLIGLKEEYDDLLNEPIVKAFLESELKVSKLISEVLGVFADTMDFDLQFLED